MEITYAKILLLPLDTDLNKRLNIIDLTSKFFYPKSKPKHTISGKILRSTPHLDRQQYKNISREVSSIRR
jgi:hypothetical protein